MAGCFLGREQGPVHLPIVVRSTVMTYWLTCCGCPQKSTDHSVLRAETDGKRVTAGRLQKTTEDARRNRAALKKSRIQNPKDWV